MNAWVKLSWKEFWLPFCYWKKGEGCPGGRDFLWLTTFLALLLASSLMLFASSEGVLNRFVDVLLGKKPGHGVPIWVIPNLLSKVGVDFIDTEVLNEIKNLGFEAHPYREIESGFNTFVELPGDGVWKNVEYGVGNLNKSRSDSIGFDGWAVYKEDPLWHQTQSSEKFPLKIILSKTLFKRYFNYNVYRKNVLDHISPEFYSELPDKLNSGAIETLNKLWLRLNFGLKSELFPFEIVWVDYIHAVEKIAFLFPLTTYHALQFNYRYPNLNYFPDAKGNGGERIRAISINNDDEMLSTPIIRFLSNICQTDKQFIIDSLDTSDSQQKDGSKNYYLNDCESVVYERFDISVSFIKNISKNRLDSYAKATKVIYRPINKIIGDVIEHDATRFYLPCIHLPKNHLNINDIKHCDQNKNYKASIDVTAKGNGFTRVLVYIPKRTQLFSAVDKLLKVKGDALAIHSVYQDALNKFGFLSRMIESMRTPFGIILFLALIVLVGIQLFTLVGHRRHRYGMFLSKGFTWWQIYFMLFIQILIAFSLAMFVAVSILHIVRFYLQNVLQTVAIDYRESLSLYDLNLMPIDLSGYLFVGVCVLMLCLLLAGKVLYFMPLRRRTHPAILFQ